MQVDLLNQILTNFAVIAKKTYDKNNPICISSNLNSYSNYLKSNSAFSKHPVCSTFTHNKK